MTRPRTFDDLAALAPPGGHPADALARIADAIHRRLETDVCSIYLLEKVTAISCQLSAKRAG